MSSPEDKSGSIVILSMAFEETGEYTSSSNFRCEMLKVILSFFSLIFHTVFVAYLCYSFSQYGEDVTMYIILCLT